MKPLALAVLCNTDGHHDIMETSAKYQRVYHSVDFVIKLNQPGNNLGLLGKDAIFFSNLIGVKGPFGTG